MWPNLLSLDAPAVALVWQDFLARTFGIPLRMPARLVLGLTVWAIYLGDRLLDVRGPATGARLRGTGFLVNTGGSRSACWFARWRGTLP